MQKESVIVLTIKKQLESEGALVFKYHGSVFGVLGHSDLYGCLRGGKFFAIEVKPPDWRPRNKQEKNRHETQLAFLKRIKDNGGLAGVARDVNEAMKIIVP